MKGILLALIVMFSCNLNAEQGMNARVAAVQNNLSFDGYFVESEVLGVIVKSESDQFTLMLDNEKQIWFDDNFILSEAECKHLASFMLKIFEEAKDKQQKAVIASIIKSMLKS